MNCGDCSKNLRLPVVLCGLMNNTVLLCHIIFPIVLSQLAQFSQNNLSVFFII